MSRRKQTGHWFKPLTTEQAALARATPAERPHVICLCGSTKFIEEFAVKTWELELQGNIVLGYTLLPSWYCGVRDHFAEKLSVKEQRDNHHLQKIDMADEVVVLSIGGYIGESTKREIEYATAKGKPVRYITEATERAEGPETPVDALTVLGIIHLECAHCKSGSLPQRVEKPTYIPNFGNVRKGNWIHCGIEDSNSGTVFCGAEHIHEHIAARAALRGTPPASEPERKV